MEPSEVSDKDYATRLTVKGAIQMLRANIMAIRGAVVRNKPEMIVEIVNEMDKTVSDLELKFESKQARKHSQ